MSIYLVRIHAESHVFETPDSIFFKLNTVARMFNAYFFLFDSFIFKVYGP